MPRKKFLLAVDGSEHSQKVLEKAIECVRQVDAEIVFVYCHEKFPELLGEPYRNREIAKILQETEKAVEPFLRRLEEEKIPVEVRLMEEPAAKRITEVADIENCDMIIMGSRGVSNLTSLIVGSVTHRVLQTAPCSVLVVR